MKGEFSLMDEIAFDWKLLKRSPFNDRVSKVLLLTLYVYSFLSEATKKLPFISSNAS